MKHPYNYYIEIVMFYFTLNDFYRHVHSTANASDSALYVYIYMGPSRRIN